MGPAVGNIFSGVVGALNGGAVAEEEEEENCVGYGGVWMVVNANGGVPNGSKTWLNDTCTEDRNAQISVDIIYLPYTGYGNANDACQAVFSKPGSDEFWPNWFNCR